MPNPVPLDELLTIDGVTHYKRIDCRRYTWCLDKAANAGWQQFHCNSCTAYVAMPSDDPQRKISLGKIGKLFMNESADDEDDVE
jgi:hypothetical protein